MKYKTAQKFKQFFRISCILLVTTFCLAPKAFSQTDFTDLPPLSPQELNVVVKEIQTMVKSSEEMVENFVVREATPSRIERLYQTPGFFQQPTLIRENGLIFAGQGSLLSFNKPSDIISKLSTWFPQEISAAQSSKSHSFFSFIHLYGPYSNWQNEPSAFLTLWNCMPQIVWLRPTQNPFMRRLDDSNPFMAISDRSSGQFDFGACVRERSGRRPVWKKEGMQAMERELLDRSNRLTPVMQDKFARFLSSNRCTGTGPDDCVLNLLLWSSLSPSDERLAKTIQMLEPDVAPDSPLPELKMEMPASGQEAHFGEGLRKAAFLRVKLLSVLSAESAWPVQALQTTLHQITLLQQQSDAARNFRWSSLDIFNNQEVNPWYPLSLKAGKSPRVQAAVMTELDSLAKNGSCDVLQEWLNGIESSLKTAFALRHLAANPSSQCIAPDWKFLRMGQSKEAQDLRSKYLDLLGHAEGGAEHEMLLNQLTSYDNNCFDKEMLKQDWLRDVCKKWVSEPMLTPLKLNNSRLTLSSEKQFKSIRLQLPASSATVSQDVAAWMTKLVPGLNSEAKTRMQALVTGIKARNEKIDSATWWHLPGYEKFLIELVNYGPTEGSRIFMVFNQDTFTTIKVPDRFFGKYDHNEIVNVSDLDDDGNLELWWAEGFRKCMGDESDLQRGLDCSDNKAEMGEIMGDTLSYFSNTPQIIKRPGAGHAASHVPPLATAMPIEDAFVQRSCNKMLIGAILKSKLDVNFRSGSNGGEVIDLVCKPHPLHPEQTIVAMFYDLTDEPAPDQNDGEKKGFAFAVVDVGKQKLLSLYRDTQEEDATTRISDFALQLDTARYNLAPGVRALGVRMNIGWSPRCAEGGENNYLTLFVEKGKQLKPVLKNLPMSRWSITNGSGCGMVGDGYELDNVYLTINVLPTISNGWHDLEVVAHHQTEAEMFSADKSKQLVGKEEVLFKLRANGQTYQ
jgi:hypothetical protein